MQGQERQQDEQPVGIDHRGRVEEQRPAEELPQPGLRKGAELGGVVGPERRAAEHCPYRS